MTPAPLHAQTNAYLIARIESPTNGLDVWRTDSRTFVQAITTSAVSACGRFLYVANGTELCTIR
jgi:hypothetical protein